MVTVMDKADAAASFQIVAELRAAGLRAEAYVGTGKFGDQMKYADRRGAAIAVIEGGDERAKGEVTLEGSGAGRRTGQIGGKPRRLDRRTPGPGQRQARRAGGGNQEAVEESVMAAFPYYDAAAIGALNDQAVALLKLFARARLYARRAVDPAAGGYFPGPLWRGNPPPHLYPDRSVRPRTVPAPRSHHSHLQACGGCGAKFPARLCYNGLAFRHQPGRPLRPTQFFQAGVELLGLADAAAGEAEILALAFDALRAAGLKDFEMRFGDLALFGALVDALELPAQWRARLKRHFWRAGYVETLLRRLGHGAGKAPSRAEIEARLEKTTGAAVPDAPARKSSTARWSAARKRPPCVLIPPSPG